MLKLDYGLDGDDNQRDGILYTIDLSQLLSILPGPWNFLYSIRPIRTRWQEKEYNTAITIITNTSLPCLSFISSGWVQTTGMCIFSCVCVRVCVWVLVLFSTPMLQNISQFHSSICFMSWPMLPGNWKDFLKLCHRTNKSFSIMREPVFKVELEGIWYTQFSGNIHLVFCKLVLVVFYPWLFRTSFIIIFLYQITVFISLASHPLDVGD